MIGDGQDLSGALLLTYDLFQCICPAHFLQPVKSCLNDLDVVRSAGKVLFQLLKSLFEGFLL